MRLSLGGWLPLAWDAAGPQEAATQKNFMLD